MNVQPPAPEEGYSNEGRSVTLDTHTGTPGDVHQRYNEIKWYSTAGPVFVVEGQWIVHQEPGFAEDVHIVGETIWLYLYLTATNRPGEDQGSGPLGALTIDALPAVGIYARIESGRFSFNPQGTLLAEGDTGANELFGVAPGAERAHLVAVDGDGPAIWEFKVPLTVHNATWESVWPNTPDGPEGPAGVTITIRIYEVREDGQPADSRGAEFMAPGWGVVSGTMPDGRFFPPRLVLPVSAPLVTKTTELTRFEKDLFFRWSYVSSFGGVDIDPLSLRTSVTGPTEVSPDLIRLVDLHFSTDHNGHLKPVKSTWRMNFLEARLADGEYTFHASVENWQGTYRLEENIVFSVQGGVPTTYESADGVVPISFLGDREGKAHELPGLSALLLFMVFMIGIRAARRR